MWLRFRPVLLIWLFSLVLFGCVAAESESENSQRIRAAPRRNIGNNVIDGTGTESTLSFDDTNSGQGEWKGSHSRVSVSTVALFTLAMAAATGLGAIPFFFVELDPQWAGICNGMASGVMLAASFDLIQEGQGHGGGNWVVIGILSGGIFILLCKKVMAVVFHFLLTKFGWLSLLNCLLFLEYLFTSIIYSRDTFVNS